MNVSIQQELLSRAWDEIQPLFRRHYEEIAHYKDIPLAPDRDKYRVLEVNEALRAYMVRGKGVLIGYAIFIVTPHLHYMTALTAVQDLLYVVPECRSAWIGTKLIRHAESELRDEGVQIIVQHVKTMNKVGLLMRRMGYEIMDEIYVKRLDKEA